MITRILKYLTAALALGLIVFVSVFSSGTAIWLGFAFAIAITAVAAADLAFAAYKRRWLAFAAAAATAPIAGFLIVASQVFEDASVSWLMVISAGAIGLLSLGEAGLPRRAVAREVGLYEFPRAEDRLAG